MVASGLSRRLRALLAAPALLGALAGCGPGGSSEADRSPPLAVAAASDLKFALDEVIARFTAEHPEITVKATYGSSGTLCAQIENGAPFDVFLAADRAYPERLIQRGLARAESLFLYATGHLVIWVRKDSGLDVSQLQARTLLAPGIRKVAIANPEHAPYGRAAVAALQSLGVSDAVAPKLVLGDNIAQAAQFVESGAADAGVIALSLALGPPMRDKGRYWEIPADAFPRLDQAGVIVASSPRSAEAAAFCAWLRSPKGRAVLARYGFLLPPGEAP